MYRFDDILALVKANKDIEIEGHIPSCPKHSDINCASIAGICNQGNNKQCEQQFVFYVNGKTLHILKPKFVIENNTKSGFFKESDIHLNMLFNKGIIEKPKPYSAS